MYTDYLKAAPGKNGMGVFTTIEIPANVPIIEVTGPVHTEESLPDPNHPAVLQVGPDTFIGPSGRVDDHINHSCNPNCLLHITGKRTIIYSIHVIPAGAELTFDYSTSSTDPLDVWQMNCKCGSPKCRKIISGYQYLTNELKEDYKKRGLVPLFISEPIFHRR